MSKLNKQLNPLISYILKNNKKLQLFFIDEKSISYEDKINILTEIFDRNQNVKFAILCADSVLHIFEEKNPKDLRVRDCLNYLKSINDFNNLSEEQLKEIKKHRSAAWAADSASAAYAAAYAATSATYAAAYAADAADAAAKDKKKQKELNLSFLKKVVLI